MRRRRDLARSAEAPVGGEYPRSVSGCSPVSEQSSSPRRSMARERLSEGAGDQASRREIPLLRV